MNSFFVLACVPGRMSINKVYIVPKWIVAGLVSSGRVLKQDLFDEMRSLGFVVMSISLVRHVRSLSKYIVFTYVCDSRFLVY